MGDSGLNIKIMGKDYRVACPSDQQASLQDSASFLNERLNDIKNKGAIIGTERIAIMAALNLAHELLNSHESIEEFSDIDMRMLNIQKKIDIALREIKVS